MNTLLLETKALQIGYPKRRDGKLRIASDINLKVFDGELVCLVGPNGVGKSTLLRTLIRLQKPLDGQIKLLGRSLESFSDQELAKQISAVLTTPVSVGMMRAEDLVGLGRFPFTGLFDRLSENDYSKISEALTMVGANELSGRLMTELSDGERQKVMIARALAQEPAILVLDEPTAFLDLPGRVSIMRVLAGLAHQHGRSVVTSTHDLDLALHNADRIWLMDKSGIVQGAPEDLVLNGQFSRTFDRDSIVFNLSTGDFSAAQPSGKQISLRGEGLSEIWTRRALIRMGLEVTESGNAAEPIVQTLTEGGKFFYKLTANGKSTRFGSIYELLKALQDTQESTSGQPSQSPEQNET